MSVLTQATADGLVMAKRNLIKVKRIPDLLIFTTVQPIMFVLLFAYVFGGAIPVPGVSYRSYLMAGIFTQTVTFGAGITAIGLADDLQKGIIDRSDHCQWHARQCCSAGRFPTWSTTAS